MWIIWLFLGEVGLIRLLLHRKYGWTMLIIFVIGSPIAIGPIITEIWNICDAFKLNAWLKQGVRHTKQERNIYNKINNGESLSQAVHEQNVNNNPQTQTQSTSSKGPHSNARMDKILEQLKKSGFTKFDTKLWVRREIKSLPNILDDNEPIKGALSGFIRHHGYKDDGRSTVLILTPKRLIFLNSGMFISNENNEISLDQVTGISSSSTLLGRVTINASGDHISIDGLTAQACRPFVKKVRKLSLQFKQRLYGGNNSQPHEDNLDKLAKAKKLLDNGTITKTDFEHEKKKLL